MASGGSNITELLVAWGGGDRKALEALMPLVYEHLRQLARHYMVRERRGHTLQTSALVNEAYLRMVDSRRVQWQNRAHFFVLAAMAR
jgi:RNA polymerase sigma-70 factor, ECF subfamily